MADATRGVDEAALVEIARTFARRVGDGGVIQLASAPHFSGLTALYLGNNQITDYGAQALAESPHLSQLKTLDLGNMAVGKKGARHEPNTIGSKGRELLLQRFTPAVCIL